MERRLAAIMATDVVGYSRLIRADEEGTLAALQALRADLIDPKIAERHGRIVKLMGDGMLVEFASVVDAVQAAVETQQAVTDHNADVPADRRIELRIGINLGDVVIDGDDIQGDGVNVAARLEAMAEPGGICVSGMVYESVRDRIDVLFEDMGEQAVKNINRPVRVWRWELPRAMTGQATGSKNTDQDQTTFTSFMALLSSVKQPSVAVLPFENMSPDEKIDFFCDGLTEGLITDLSRSSRLAVVARNSSFALKGKSLDARKIGVTLGVDFLIEGSVQVMGNRMRVNAQLIDAASGEHLWADRYDRATDDLFAVQDDLCDAILVETDVMISSGETARERYQGTKNAEARRYAQRASVSHGRYTHEDLIKAQQDADKAIAIDPVFPGAMLMAALCRLVRILQGWTTEETKLLDEARDIADRMIDLDAKSGYSNAIRGYVHLVAGEFDAAVEKCGHGVELSPNISGPRAMYARALLAIGRFDEAYHEIVQALRLQPNIFPFYLSILGVICLMTGRNANSIAAFNKFRELGASITDCNPYLGAAYAANNNLTKARVVVDEVMSINPNLTIDDVIKPYPFRDPGHRAKLADFLKQAGVLS